MHKFFYVIGVLTLAGCASMSSSPSLPVSVPDSFSQNSSVDHSAPNRWWTAFDDTTLNDLVDQALYDNLTLKTAWYRLQESRAIVQRSSSSFFPTLDIFGQGQRARSRTTDTETFELGLMADYEVDLWGRVRADVQADQFEARAAFADYQAAALSLSAEVARTWYRLSAAQQRLGLLQEQVRTNQQILALIKERFVIGQRRQADILRQQQLLSSTREQYSEAKADVQVFRHQLAVLLGQAPQSLAEMPLSEWPTIPALPQTGLPVDLIERRPDVRNAFYLLQAADSNVAAAVRDQYPRLRLSGSVDTTESSSEDLFDFWARSLTANLVAPLLDAGRREAETDRTRAVKQQRLFSYGQAVLTAFREVEDALILEQNQAERLRYLEEQVALAEETVERLNDQYLNGTGNYLDVLDALTDQQQLQRDLITARLTRLEYRIALYRALAGGFDIQREVDDES